MVTTESSLVTKHGSIIAIWRVNDKVWNGNIHIRPARKVQKPTAKKTGAYRFWGLQGPVLEHYQERDTTINSAGYSEMLTDWLKPAVRSKRRGPLSKGVVLLHDNDCPHC
jgi:hypothetical protein